MGQTEVGGLIGQTQENNQTVQHNLANLTVQPNEEDVTVQLKKGGMTVQSNEKDLTIQSTRENLKVPPCGKTEHPPVHPGMEEITTQMQQAKLEVEQLKKERDLYLGKLHEVELSCSGSTDTGGQTVRQVLDILHGREGGSAVPAVPAVPQLETVLLPSHGEREERCEPVTMTISTQLHIYTTLWLRKSPSPAPGDV